MIIYDSESTGKRWTIRESDFLLYFRGCYFVASCEHLRIPRGVYFIQQANRDDVYLCADLSADKMWKINNIEFVIHQHYPESGYQGNKYMSKTGVRSASKAANPETFKVLDVSTKRFFTGQDYHSILMNISNWSDAALSFEVSGKRYGYGGVEIGRRYAKYAEAALKAEAPKQNAAIARGAVRLQDLILIEDDQPQVPPAPVPPRQRQGRRNPFAV